MIQQFQPQVHIQYKSIHIFTKNICTIMFIAVLFTLVPNLKQSKFSKR